MSTTPLICCLYYRVGTGRIIVLTIFVLYGYDIIVVVSPYFDERYIYHFYKFYLSTSDCPRVI